MKNLVFKTEEGRQKILSFYNSILNTCGLSYERISVPFEDISITVLRFGDRRKRPVVALHGTMSNSASWLGMVPALTKEFCLYCVDIPGEPGLSSPVRFDYTSENSWRWISSVLDFLALERPAFLGMSLGSWYILNYVLHEPERSSCASLITTSGITSPKSSFFIKMLFCMMLGSYGRKKMTQLIYHKVPVDALALEFQNLSSVHVNPVTAVIPIFTDEQLLGLSVPIQYFGGDCDSLLDTASAAERLHRLVPSADIHVLKDTGHVILDQTDKIITFLSR